MSDKNTQLPEEQETATGTEELELPSTTPDGPTEEQPATTADGPGPRPGDKNNPKP